MAKILVIDDEEPVLKLLQTLLETEGHKVIPVIDSSKATAIIEKNNFDLIITDIRMRPVSGMDILKYIHEHKSQTPVIVVSAYSADKTIWEITDPGNLTYIRKPFQADELLDAVRKWVKK